MKSFIWPLSALALVAFLFILYLTGSFNSHNKIFHTEVPPRTISYTPAQELILQISKPSEHFNHMESDLKASVGRISDLEDEIQKLHQRITQLEEREGTIQLQKVSQFPEHIVPPDEVKNRVNGLSKAALLQAGVSEVIAMDIMQHHNETEMQKLELRDNAIRNDYLNTPKYYQALRAIDDSFKTLHNEIGDRAYDHVLYATGRNNRVKVLSVIPNSPSDLAGLNKNDIILQYSDKAVFNPEELRNSTTQGHRGEYTNITLLRNGTPLTLMVPRGPLGIRLNPTRLNPQVIGPR
ncbi:MAG: PDZ domain-containing protein [Gammaproteobacteria bacterium]